MHVIVKDISWQVWVSKNTLSFCFWQRDIFQFRKWNLMAVRCSVNGRRGQDEVSKCCFDTWLQKEVRSTFNILLRTSSENTASYFTSEACKWWSSAQDYQDCSKALNFSCKSFLCKFCLDYLMKWYFFFLKQIRIEVWCILRAFWHAVSWMAIIWVDYC